MKLWLNPDLKNKLASRLSEKNPLIQVLIGPRQVGKSSFIEAFTKKSKKFLICAGDGIDDPIWIQQKWNQAQENHQCLIIDEIQKIPQWSEFVKTCWDKQKFSKNKINVILLGSSSMSLDSGLSESLTGRFEVIRLYHWSFEESQKITKLSLDDYIRYGGYPGSYEFIKDESRWSTYLRSSIIETVITKDILLSAKVKSPALFRQCFYLATSFPAQVLSYNKLLGQLQDRGNIDLVKYYLDLFDKAYLIKCIPKFTNNVFSKKSSSPKIIPLTPALCTFHLKSEMTPEYLGRVFEALVGAKLIQVFDEIFYWAEADFEVDFVIQANKKIYAIEVKSGRNKKAKSLIKFLEKYPKAEVVFITKDNFAKFEKDPMNFFNG